MALLSTGVDYGISAIATDQAGKVMRIWWSFQMEPTPLSHFIFVDNSFAGISDGSFAAPFKTFGEPGYLVYGNGASGAGKICVLKQGNSATPGSEYQRDATTGPYWPRTNSLPHSVINIPGEQPVIDLNAIVSFGLEGTLPTNDFMMYGLKLINGWSTATGGGAGSSGSNGRGAFVSIFGNDAKRILIAHNVFDTVTSWITVSNFNNGAITLDNPNSAREHVVISNNEFANAVSPATNNIGAIVMQMGGDKILIEDNTVRDWGTTSNGIEVIIKLKKPSDNTTVRRNVIVDNVTVWTDKYGIEVADDQANSPFQFDNLEVSYNVFEFPTTLRPRWMGMTASAATRTGNVYIFRNTGKGCDFFSNLNSTVTEMDANDHDGVLAVGPNVTIVSDYPTISTDYQVGTQLLTSAFLTANSLEDGEVGHKVI